MKSKSINSLEYKYSDRLSKDRAYLLLHGVRGGIDEAYITTLLGKLVSRGDTALAFNFPYISRGDTNPSGGRFEEELSALHLSYNFLKAQGKERVHLIGKSFGGMLVTHWLAENPRVEGVNASIMGYIHGENSVLPDTLRGRLGVVVQGEFDRYCTPEEVRRELRAHNVEGEVVEIPGADHSYRDMVNPNPVPYAFQEHAIDELLKRV